LPIIAGHHSDEQADAPTVMSTYSLQTVKSYVGDDSSSLLIRSPERS